MLRFEDGTPVKLFDVPRFASFNDAIRWIPNSKALTYRDRDKGIWRQDLDGGPPQRLESLPEEPVFRFGWSRDGKHFAFTGKEANKRCGVVARRPGITAV